MDAKWNWIVNRSVLSGLVLIKLFWSPFLWEETNTEGFFFARLAFLGVLLTLFIYDQHYKEPIRTRSNGPFPSTCAKPFIWKCIPLWGSLSCKLQDIFIWKVLNEASFWRRGDSEMSCYMKVTRSAGKPVRVSYNWLWFYFLIQSCSVDDTKPITFWMFCHEALWTQMWNRELTLKCKLKCYVKPMK